MPNNIEELILFLTDESEMCVAHATGYLWRATSYIEGSESYKLYKKLAEEATAKGRKLTDAAQILNGLRNK